MGLSRERKEGGGIRGIVLRTEYRVQSAKLGTGTGLVGVACRGTKSWDLNQGRSREHLTKDQLEWHRDVSLEGRKMAKGDERDVERLRESRERAGSETRQLARIITGWLINR